MKKLSWRTSVRPTYDLGQGFSWEYWTQWEIKLGWCWPGYKRVYCDGWHHQVDFIIGSLNMYRNDNHREKHKEKHAENKSSQNHMLRPMPVRKIYTKRLS